MFSCLKLFFNLIWIFYEVNCGKPIVNFDPVEFGNDNEPSLKIVKIFPDGAIIVDINLPGSNGLKDSMTLRSFIPSDADQNHNHCNYVGELASNKKATVSVSGCIGREDVTTTITSDKHSNMTHIWKLYGVVEEVTTSKEDNSGSNPNAVDGFDQNSNQIETTSNGQNLDEIETTTENLDEVESSTNDQDDFETSTEGTNDIPIPKEPIDHIECAMKLKGNIQGLIPSDLTLQLSVNYDDTFLESFNHDKAKAEASIREAITQAQPIFLDSTLGTKVHLKPVGDFIHWSGERMHATEKNMNHFVAILKKANPSPERLSNSFYYNATHVMFTNYTQCKSDNVGLEDNCASGQASLASACASTRLYKSNYRLEFGEFLPSIAIVEKNPGGSFGWLLAHELGHVLGMDHDAKWEEGNERPVVPKGYCNDVESGKLTNIMRNLLAPKRRTWSICNRCDLLITYQTEMIHFGYYCLAPQNKLNSLRNTYF